MSETARTDPSALPRRFSLVGGDPALDFVNTVHDWTASRPRDFLPTFADALRFGVAAGLLTPPEARRLGLGRPRTELRRLRDLRARLERICRAVIVGRSPLAADLEALARDAADAARTARFRSTRRGIARELQAPAAGPATLRWRVVEHAVALLTSARVSQMKSCPSCGWLFLDSTKNKSRRWCRMATCGSHAKSRRYYWRSKRRAAQTAATP